MLEGKLALVAGVANRRSIAWAIAQELHARGAKLAFTYQGERIEKSVTRAGRARSAPTSSWSATCAPTRTSTGPSARSRAGSAGST